jgi:hypothetical protein
MKIVLPPLSRRKPHEFAATWDAGAFLFNAEDLDNYRIIKRELLSVLLAQDFARCPASYAGDHGGRIVFRGQSV